MQITNIDILPVSLRTKMDRDYFFGDVVDHVKIMVTLVC